ncbi:MAG TPA: chemotaxis protein CheD [Opitutaceae bacterium]|nr:chemotaxis protein CheD [Opitutaceae bacterium]
MGAPTISALFAQRVVVGVGDMGVSNNPQITLSTYALGSCVAVVVYDPFAKVGGLLHLMLPDSTISPGKAASQPAMFADTGLPLLFRSLAGLKADLTRVRIFLAGGANVLCDADTFRIGERNIEAAAEFLSRNGFPIRLRSLGGSINRTVHLNVGNGDVTLKTPGANDLLSLGGL